MRNYKIAQVEVEELDSITCDRCGKKITKDDFVEWQESYSIDFIGGYGSVFGDSNRVSCDLCQKCLYELIGEFCTYED